MSEYQSLIEMADRLIKKKGRSDVSVIQPTPNSATDDSKPWKLDSAVSDTVLASNLHAVLIDIRTAQGEQGQFGFNVFFRSRVEMPDSLMPGTTAIAYFSAKETAGISFEPGHLITTLGKRFAIMRCDPLQPGNELVMNVVQLRE